VAADGFNELQYKMMMELEFGGIVNSAVLYSRRTWNDDDWLNDWVAMMEDDTND